LKFYNPDVEAIKGDMHHLVKELEQRGIITLSKTIIFGRSLGSHMASYLMSVHEFMAGILFCGFWSVEKIVAKKVGNFLGSMIKQKCDNSEYLSMVRNYVLIIHGMKVEVN